MKTIFDQITDNLRQIIEKHKTELAEKDSAIVLLLKKNNEALRVRDKVIIELQAEIERLEEQNHRLRQELEHKAFQDDF